MKGRLLAFLAASALICPAAVAQNNKSKETTTKETTMVRTETKAVASGYDLLSNWNFDDSTPVTTGTVSLRLGYQYWTQSEEQSRGDRDDDHVINPQIFWGAAEGLEISVSVPVWVGDSGETGDNGEGNADTYLAFLWNFLPDQDGFSMALKGAVRAPTGDNSNGVDGELRLILSHQCSESVRGHINAFAISANGDNDEDLRNFHWGAVFGLDGPLFGDESLRWVADYMHRSGEHFGSRNINMLELGTEWTIDASNRLASGIQIGLDDNEDTPNFGARLTYAYSIGY